MGLKGVLIQLALYGLVIVLVWTNTSQWLEPEPPEIVVPNNTTIDRYAQLGYSIHFVDLADNPRAFSWNSQEQVYQNLKSIRAQMRNEERALFASFFIDSDGFLRREYAIVDRDQGLYRVSIQVYPEGEQYYASKAFFYLKDKTPREIIYEKNIQGAWMMIGMLCFVCCFSIFLFGVIYRAWQRQR